MNAYSAIRVKFCEEPGNPPVVSEKRISVLVVTLENNLMVELSFQRLGNENILVPQENILTARYIDLREFYHLQDKKLIPISESVREIARALVEGDFRDFFKE